MPSVLGLLAGELM
uniref:Uncharacterized protein n=1 Tax=Arundo donax TaxID=35708 RepID=A0A0A9F1K0_ARUDO